MCVRRNRPLKEARVNMMDFRVGDETESWFKTSFNLVKRFIAEGGYRLYPDKVSLRRLSRWPDSYNRTPLAQYRLGYLPNNLQQWNYKYKVAFALLNNNGEPVQVFVEKSASHPNGRRAIRMTTASMYLPGKRRRIHLGCGHRQYQNDNKPGINWLCRANPHSRAGSLCRK